MESTTKNTNKVTTEKFVYIIDETDRYSIYEAKNQISNGEVFTDEEVQNEINTWLAKLNK